MLYSKQKEIVSTFCC